MTGTILAAQGGVAGISFLFSMLGQGGGMVYMPLFHWLGWSVKTVAIPLGILLSAAAKLFALPTYQRARLIDWPVAGPMMAAIVAGAVVGARLTGLAPATTLLLAFAIVLAVAGARTLWVAHDPEPELALEPATRLLVGMTVALVAGLIGGFLGIAGGFIISPVLIWAGYRSKQAAATTAAVATASSFAGFLGHLGQTALAPTLVLATFAAAVLGSVAGAWFMAHKARPAWIKTAYGIVLFGVAGQLFGETTRLGPALIAAGLGLGAAGSLLRWGLRAGGPALERTPERT
jgi:uncharacterized membrane protein YfcA